MRLINVTILPETVADLCRTGKQNDHLWIEGVPKDAQVVSVNFNSMIRAFVCCFEHESFEDVIPGEAIPFRSVVYTKISPSDQVSEFTCKVCEIEIRWRNDRWEHTMGGEMAHEVEPVDCYPYLCGNTECPSWVPPGQRIKSCCTIGEYDGPVQDCKDFKSRAQGIAESILEQHDRNQPY